MVTGADVLVVNFARSWYVNSDGCDNNCKM